MLDLFRRIGLLALSLPLSALAGIVTAFDLAAFDIKFVRVVLPSLNDFG